MNYYIYLGIQILLASLGFYMQYIGQSMLKEYDHAAVRANVKGKLYLGMFAFIFGTGAIAFALLAF